MKKYSYGGEIFCEEDLSEEIDNYGGDLYDLYWELKTNGLAGEHTYYSPAECESSRNVYDSPEELIEDYFNYLEVSE